MLKNPLSLFIIWKKAPRPCGPECTKVINMFGYITPFIPELKVRDKELYQSYYCGLCRALGKYGLGSKLSLTYDATFAAALLSAVCGNEPSFEKHTCAVHPMRGKTPMVCCDDVMDFCAGVCVLLAKYKLLDDAQDGRPIRKAGLPMLSRGIKRAGKKYPEAAAVLERGLKKFGELESSADFDPDDAPLLFGGLLGELLSACPFVPEDSRPLIKELGAKLGGYVYVIDDWDDREEDKKKGSYNIFNRSEFEDPRETCAALLDMYINSAVLAYDLLDVRINKPLLDNVMYVGLGARAAEVINGEASRRRKNKKEEACPGEAAPADEEGKASEEKDQ